MSDLDEEPTLVQLLQGMLRTLKRNFHVSLPGIVSTYNNDNTADIQITLAQRRLQPDGTYADVAYPTLRSVPIAWPRTNGGYLTFPLAAGDNVEVIFSDADTSDWIASQNVSSGGTPISPGDGDTHTLAGAYAILGGYPSGSPISPSNNSDTVLNALSGKLSLNAVQGDVNITAPSGNINLSTAADFVALATKVETELNKIAAAINAATYINAAGIPTVLVFTPPNTYLSAGSVAATKVKAT